MADSCAYLMAFHFVRFWDSFVIALKTNSTAHHAYTISTCNFLISLEIFLFRLRSQEMGKWGGNLSTNIREIAAMLSIHVNVN